VISVVAMVANPFCGLFKVVAFGTPLKLMTAPGAKFKPLTVMKNGRVPATAVVGKMVFKVGTG